ncbi:hypothetical protein GRS48_14115 [Halorubrum sp. JWXQ-INN 858]|uniref:hypothetical protein n=1 Tax=Halorubrum sp. JWXQ-INN 858 TaxID=2690782 RepID=UPI001356FF1F|nr:hypothetical protein [Halorubrum sp. JWXQ-INN 858]MWV65944.1 hypothetical protein [Halorubrum sp. JWXQ-INN 858]
MTRCRLHVILPDNDEVPYEIAWSESTVETLRTRFDDTFGLVDTASIQDNKQEWVSDVFEETEQNMSRVDEFERTCDELFSEIDTLMTRRERDKMDGQGTAFDYDDALMLQLTFRLVT